MSAKHNAVEALSTLQAMAEESLDPETFGKWEDVVHVLRTNRGDLNKYQPTPGVGGYGDNYGPDELPPLEPPPKEAGAVAKVVGPSHTIPYPHLERLRDVAPFVGQFLVPAVKDTADKCIWYNDEGEDEGTFTTSCGGRFTLNEGNPIANGMKFCYRCGKPIDYTPPEKDGE